MSRGQAVDEAIEQRLRLGIDPVEVLEHEDDRLDLCLVQHQPLADAEDALAALRGIHALPLQVVVGDVQEREDGRRVGEEEASVRLSLSVTLSRMVLGSSRSSILK